MTLLPALRFSWAPKALVFSLALAAVGTAAAETVPPTAPGQPVWSMPQVAFPVNVMWSGSTDDGGSGLARYEVEASLNDGGWQLDQVVSNPTPDVPAAYDFSGVEGYWKLRVRAFDGDMNPSSYSPESSVLTMDLTDPLPPVDPPTASLVRDGGWARVTWGNDGFDPGQVSSGIRLYGMRTTSVPSSSVPFCQVVATTCDIPVRPGYQYTMNVQSMDNAGNVGSFGQPGRFNYPGPASDLRLLGQGSGLDASYAVVGDPYPVTVEAIDSEGDVAPAYGGTVGFGAWIPGGPAFPATLPLDGGTYRFVAVDQGRRAFSPGFIFHATGSVLAGVADRFDSSLSAEVLITVISPTDIRIIHDANPSAARGVPYLYNAAGRVRVVTSDPPVTFSFCSSSGSVPNGFVLESAGGAISWTPESGTNFPVDLCVQAKAAGGATDTYSFRVSELTPSNNPPSAFFTATPGQAGAGVNVVFDPTASSWDQNLGSPAFRWRFGDGSPLSFRRDPFHAYLLPGGYRPAMTLFDGIGRSDLASRQVLITDQVGNLPPSLVILTLPPPGEDSLDVVLAARADDGAIATGPIRWDLGNGAYAEGPDAGATYGPGRYWATAATVDQNGLPATDKVEIAVSRDDRVPPQCVATADPPVAFVTPANGGRADVDWIAWRAPGTKAITSVRWTIDGVPFIQGVVSKQYSETGWYHGALAVTDEEGLTCTDSVSVLVLDSSAPALIVPPRILDPGVTGPIDCTVDYVGRAAVASGKGPFTWSLADPDVPLAIDGPTGQVTWTPSVLPGVNQLAYGLRVIGPTGTDRVDVRIPYTCKDSAVLDTKCGCGEGGGVPAIAGLALLSLWAAARRRSAVRVRARRP